MMNLSLQQEVEEKMHEKISASQKLDIMIQCILDPAYIFRFKI